MLRNEKVKRYPDDEDLLEDVIIENKQAMEMANIYNGILSGMVDTFASVISNNLNIVMKFLATVTIVMSIPTMIASFYGMNVPLPGHDNPYGFYIVLGFALLLAGIVALIFHKKEGAKQWKRENSISRKSKLCRLSKSRKCNPKSSLSR